MDLDEEAEMNVSEGSPLTAIRQRSCPICLILQIKSTDLMCELQFEAVHNPEVNARCCRQAVIAIFIFGTWKNWRARRPTLSCWRACYKN